MSSVRDDGNLSTVSKRVATRLRGAAYWTYFRLVRLNYERKLVARTNHTPAGTFRSYELLNRHGDDRMLEAMADWCGADSIIYDIGANVGIYAIALSLAEPNRRVVAFEPAPRTVEQLRANLACNDLEDRVDVHQCGVGDVDEYREFYVSTLPELSGFDRESATRWGASVAESVSVRILQLDTIRETTSTPDVLKIDVEGAGPAVLRGGLQMLKGDRPVLFVEPHGEELSNEPVEEMKDILRGCNYRIEIYDEYWRCLPD